MDALFASLGGPDKVALWSAALAAALGVLSLWFGAIEGQGNRARLRRVAQLRRSLQADRIRPQRQQLRHQGLDFMRQVVRRMQLQKQEETRKLRMHLARAGWRGRDAMTVYLFAKLVLPFAMAAVSILLLYGVNLWGLSGPMKLLAATAAVGFAAYLPDLLVTNASQKRRQAIRKGLPDALDLLVICSEAGLSLDSAAERVGRELGRTWPVLADEFLVLGAELAFLPERQQALTQFAERTGLPAARALVNTLIQAERYGTPLSQAMRVIADELRTDRLMVAEEKAAKLPAILTVPMIVFILPCLFVVLLGPAILRMIDGLGGL